MTLSRAVSYTHLDVYKRQGVIRPFLENEHFGRWNYPLGVTLYGFLKAEKAFGCARAGMYARSHIRRCTEMYHYSLWDKQRYVVPYINHQITDIDMLDDCGSFSSTMLESAGIAPDRSQREIADMVAAYMAEIQEKTEEDVYKRQIHRGGLRPGGRLSEAARSRCGEGVFKRERNFVRQAGRPRCCRKV